MAVIKPLPTGGAPAPSLSSTPGASSPDHSVAATSTSTTASTNHFMHSPPVPSYAQPTNVGYGLGLDGATGSPLARSNSAGGSGGGAGAGATAANASDLLLSFLTQTVREMKEKITSLEDDNQHLRTKHRKLKRRLKDNDERVELLFSTVANLAQAHAPQQQQQRVQTMPTARSNFYASTLSALSSSSSTMQPSSTSPPSSSSSPTSSSASSSSSSYDSYYAYPLPTTTTSATSRLALSHQQHQQMPLQDFLDRSLATENAAPAVSYGSGGGGQSAPALHNHQRATLLQQYQQQRQQMQQQQQQQQQQLYPGAGDLSSTISGYAAAPVFSTTAGFQQQQQKQQQQPAAAAAAAAAMRMMMEPSPVCNVPGLGVPSYTLNSVSDIKRHFPYFDECYFDKAHFVVNDLRKPYLVMQFVSMDSTVVTASEAYLSLSGFTLHEVCHTKKLVALLPRSYKKRMIPLFVHNNEPNSTTILETAGQLVRKDGQIVSLDYQMQFFFDALGKVKWLCASIEKMVGVDKSFVYNNSYGAQNDEERIKLLRDRLRDQEKQEWDELIHEYLRSTAPVPVLTLTPCLESDIAATQQQPSSNPTPSSSSSSSSSSSTATSSLTQQDLPSSSSSSSMPSSRAVSAGGLSTTSSSSGINSPPVSPLSPMTTSWLAEMLATPPSTSSSGGAANTTSSSGMGYD